MIRYVILLDFETCAPGWPNASKSLRIYKEPLNFPFLQENSDERGLYPVEKLNEQGMLRIKQRVFFSYTSVMLLDLVLVMYVNLTITYNCGKFSIAGILVFKAITHAADEIIKAETQLNELDNAAGDGDCGTTLKRGAEG